jgi:small nuclear ribonucleoprotein (snRNP)-like protein
MDGWKNYEGKQVFVRLKSGRIYTGRVVQADTLNSNSFFLVLLDKFKKRVSIASSEIAVLQEEE